MLVNWMTANICKMNLLQIDAVLEENTWFYLGYYLYAKPPPWLASKFLQHDKFRPDMCVQLYTASLSHTHSLFINTKSYSESERIPTSNHLAKGKQVQELTRQLSG